MSLTKQETLVTYNEFIKNIIQTRGRHGCGNQYHERHHIVPKCLGGENKEENYIDLFPREHFIAHKLLALENLENNSLQSAWWCMSSMKNGFEQRYECTSEEFEQARIAMRDSKKGIKFTEEHKQKISEATKGKKNHNFGCHNCKEKSPNWGKKWSKETKDKMSEAHNIPVMCIETGMEYESAKEVERKLGLFATSITACCKGKQKTCGKFHWKYVVNKISE